jgi:tetratricopeptide (TPR) repeat protein
LKEGALEEAEASLSQAVKMKSENINYLLALTDALVESKKYDTALKNVLKAVKLKPESTKAVFSTCNVYRKKGYYTVAIGYCEKAQSLSPNDPRILNRLAWLYAKKGVKLVRGMEIMEKILKANPNRPSYLDTLSELYYVQGKTDEAVANIRVAIKLKPEDAYYKKQLWKFKNVVPKNLAPTVSTDKAKS